MTGKSKVVRLRICPGILVKEVSRQRTPIATSRLVSAPFGMAIFLLSHGCDPRAAVPVPGAAAPVPGAAGARSATCGAAQPPAAKQASRPRTVAVDPKWPEVHFGLLTGDDLGDQFAAHRRKADADVSVAASHRHIAVGVGAR